MLEPSLHRRRRTVLNVSCRVRLSSYTYIYYIDDDDDDDLCETGTRLHQELPWRV